MGGNDVEGEVGVSEVLVDEGDDWLDEFVMGGV